MAKPLRETLVDIADAIRAKDPTAGQMTSQEMPAKIAAIPSGGATAPYNINHFYPLKFMTDSNYNTRAITQDDIDQRLKPGGDEGTYTEMDYMFYRCKEITSLPGIDMHNVTSAKSMFGYCSKLEHIGTPEYPLDFNSITKPKDIAYILQNTGIDVGGVKSLYIINLRVDLTLPSNLSHDNTMFIINHLCEVDPHDFRKLYMDPKLLNKLTKEEKQIAIDKGWYISES